MKNYLFAALALSLFVGCATQHADHPTEHEPIPTERVAQFRYNELMIKDYDEMSQMVNVLVKKARSQGEDEEAIGELREAVQLILSRPDSDNMVAKLMPEVRKELIGYNSFEKVLTQISSEGIAELKDDKAPASSRATATFVLENLLSQIRPEVANNLALRHIAERIKNAKLKIDTGIRKDMKLRGMFSAQNPSATAATILKEIPAGAKK